LTIGEIKRKTHFLPLLNSFLPFSNDWILLPLIVDPNDLNPDIEEEDEDEDDDVELKEYIV